MEEFEAKLTKGGKPEFKPPTIPDDGDGIYEEEMVYRFKPRLKLILKREVMDESYERQGDQTVLIRTSIKSFHSMKLVVTSSQVIHQRHCQHGENPRVWD